MKKLSFGKYQALGNSFIVLDKPVKVGRSKDLERLARRICSPTYGIGADGLMIASLRQGQVCLDIYNADGSWAEKSGNGLRIAAMHLKSLGIIKKNQVRLITGSGLSEVRFSGGGKYRQIISASLGKPVFEARKIPVKSEKKFFINQIIDTSAGKLKCSAVSIGNPHLVLFCNDLDFEWAKLGAELEKSELFPERTNVGFVLIKNRKTLEVRDFERGVGPTDSSGTGAAAAMAVAIMRGFCERTVTVRTLAGDLEVSWPEQNDEIRIKGPVEFIGAGEYLLAD